MDVAPFAGDLLATEIDFGEGEASGSPRDDVQDDQRREETVDAVFSGAEVLEAAPEGEAAQLDDAETEELLAALDDAFAEGSFLALLSTPGI